MNTDDFPIVAGGEARAELEISNSHFIASAAPATSVEQAKEYIARIRAEYPDATHHVPVYVIGSGANTLAHCSDAGEPAGTAGRPALAVVQGSGVGDVVLVITRYFGGTKLGTGGLVRAYTDSAKAVLEILPRAQKVTTYLAMAAFPYPYFERIRILVREFKGIVVDETFAADVTLTMRFASRYLDDFQSALRELTRGEIQVEIIETDASSVMPLGLM